MTLWKWSRTAASNATADSTINWAEGQAPSSVNDSARAEMAAVAKYRDDVAGIITTGGTSTAYTVTSYQVFDTLAHMNGARIGFVPHATNGATVTLNVDSLGAKPLRSAPNVELPSGVLVQGTPYFATYNNSDAVWYLSGFYVNPYQIPIGGLMPYISSTAPNSAFVLPYGQAISRTTYSALFNLTSTVFGVGDGSTTFNIPDLRGRVPAGKDGMGGIPAGRLTTGLGVDADTLGSVGGTDTITLDSTMIPSHTHAGSTTLADKQGTVAAVTPTGGGSYIQLTGSAVSLANITGTYATTGATGGGAAHKNVQPTIILTYIMRVI